MSALSVLVVDSDPTLRGALTRLLEDRNFHVHAVQSRAEAFDTIDAQPVDVLILDDPGQERCYRLVWLTEDVPDSRVELIDLDPESLSEQFDELLGVSDPLASSGVVEFDAAEFGSAETAA